MDPFSVAPAVKYRQARLPPLDAMSPKLTQVQLQLDFEGGLTRRYPTFRHVLQASAWNNPRGKQVEDIAKELDHSPSAFSRMLSGQDGRHFPGEQLSEYIESTGDLRPIYWLIERHIPNEDQRRRMAIQQVEQLLPELTAALAAAREG